MKKPTKRKMYQKRRKKEKAEQRKKVQSMLPGTTATTSYKYNNYTRKQLERNKAHQNLAFSPITSYSLGLQLWWQSYCSAIEFHTNQQNAWPVERQENKLILFEKFANEYETSSEEEENNVCDVFNTNENNISGETIKEYVDDEYIKFLEITHKHQEEMRLKRAEGNL